MWRVLLSDRAVRQLKRIHKHRRTFIKEEIWKHLAQSDPLQAGRNKLRLRRASEYAEFELRLEPWRVFYRVRGGLVEVVLIGEKRGNKLLIEGEEFVL